MLQEAKEEKKHLEEDKKAGIEVTPPPPKPEDKDRKKPKSAKAIAEQDEEDPLKEVLTGFFFTFNDFEREFEGEPRKKMHDGNPVYEQIKTLYGKVKGDE